MHLVTQHLRRSCDKEVKRREERESNREGEEASVRSVGVVAAFDNSLFVNLNGFADPATWPAAYPFRRVLSS